MLFHNTTGKGQDIVLIHGWGFHGGIWHNLLPLLDGYRVTTVDLPGFGQSELAVDRDKPLAQQYAEQVLAVAPENAIWVGWSMGGLIATTAALIASERVNRLINVATTPYFVKQPDWPGIEIDVLESFFKRLTQDFKKTITEFLLLQGKQMKEMAHTIKTLKLELFKYSMPNIKSLTTGMHLLQQTDLRKQLCQLTQPVEYILGQQDALVPVAVADHIPELNPNVRVNIIEKAGHTPFLSHPEQFVELINAKV